MKTIELFGKEWYFAFNLAVQRTFETLTGKDFDLALLAHQEHRINLYISIILANNEMNEGDAKDFTRQFLYETTFEDLKRIDAMANEVIRSWYNIPSSAKLEDNQGEEKNA